MDLSLKDLPEEVVEIIAEYLSLDDVRACSSVDKKWREAFNNDRIWKRYRTFHPDYFHNQSSKLNYLSEDDCKGCQVKQHVFRELTVQRNLSSGNFHMAKVKTDELVCWKLTDVVDEIGNHWLFMLGGSEFVGSSNKCKLQAWKLNDDPVLISSIENIQLCEVQEVCLKIQNNKVFVILKKSVHVYEFGYPQYQIKSLFKVEAPKVLEPFRSRCVYTNSLILCFFHKIHNNTKATAPNVYVWDEKGSLMLKRDGFPREEGCASMFYLRAVEAGDSDCVLVATKHISRGSGEGRDVLQLFNTNTFQFITVLNEQENRSLDFMLVFGNVVCFLYRQQYTGLTRLKCFNSSGVEICNTTLVEPAVDWKLFSSCQNHKIVLLENSTILVFDLTRQLVEIVFKISAELGSLRKAFSLKNNLLFVLGSSYDQVTSSVYNIKTGKHINSLSSFPPCKNPLSSISCIGNGQNRSPPKIIVDTCQEELGSGHSCRVFVVSFW